MRIGVTGSGGFAGRWLSEELRRAGHEVIGADRAEVDVRDRTAVGRWLRAVRPDAIAHLAAVSFGPDAAADEATALDVNAGGTRALLDAALALPVPPAVLVTGSADVYTPPPDDRALDEGWPVGPVSPYGRSKLAQEHAALAVAARHDLRLAVTRAFNHTGPRQRREFVVPALARRVAEVAAGRNGVVTVGNLDVRRDFSDVRDVVVAYRLVLEALAGGILPPGGTVLNVASGHARSIREVLAALCAIAGAEADAVVDPRLVRTADPPVIRGDASRLRATTGWRPRIAWEQTLADVYAEAVAGVTARAS